MHIIKFDFPFAILSKDFNVSANTQISALYNNASAINYQLDPTCSHPQIALFLRPTGAGCIVRHVDSSAGVIELNAGETYYIGAMCARGARNLDLIVPAPAILNVQPVLGAGWIPN